MAKICVNDRYEYPAGKTPAYKVPGVYKLTKDIPNPNSDGRSKRWQRQGTIPAGRKFLLRDNRRRDYMSEVEGGPPIIMVDGCEISLMRGYSYDTMDPTFYAYEDMMAALEPIEEVETEDYLTNLKHQHGYAADPADIVARLLINGVITREQVEEAIQQNDVES